LAEHADGALARLGKSEVEIARRILLRLVTPEGTRRLISRTDALGGGLGEGAPAVLGELVRARLVSIRKPLDARNDDPELELVHESLIASWRTLSRWIEESKEERLLLDELSRAARSWVRRGRPKDEVWQGRALADGLRLAEHFEAETTAEMRSFLDAGRALRERRDRTKSTVVLVALVGLVAVIAVLYAEMQAAVAERKEADVQRNLARARWAAAERERAAAALAGGDVLEARAHLRSALEVLDSAEVRVLW